MKNIFFTFLSLLFAFSVSAQLTNNGATIIVEDGATLFIETSLNNNTTGGTVGSIDIQGTGKVEVQGDVVNAGTITMSDDAKIVFSGAAAANVTSGGATFTNVEMDKTAEDITLMDAMIVSKDLNFIGDDNKVILGANNLTLTTDATITSADDNEYIVADAAGTVTKEMDAAAMFEYEIGTAGDEYTPLVANVTAGTFPLSLAVNTVSMKQGDVPAAADSYINRYWNVDAADDTNLEATLTGTYVAGDLEAGSTAADVKGAHYDGMNWSYAGAMAGANQAIGDIAANGDFTGTNSFGKVNLKLFMQGPFAGGAMTQALNTGNFIPTTSPYDPSVSVGSIPADVVDWINIELRDATTPATVLSSTSAFIKIDGTVVGTDGTSLPILANPNGSTGHVVIKHRNHLPIRTASPLNISTPSLHDFSTGLGQAYDDASITLNDAMVDLGSGVYGLFRANVNSDNFVNILDAVLTRINSNPTQVGVYSSYDVNLDGNVNILDSVFSRLQSNPTKTAHQ